MSKRLWIVPVVVLLFLLSGIILWRLLPTAVEALPSQISARIPDEVLVYITTPLPTALPKPIAPSPGDLQQIVIPTIQPTPTVTEVVNPTEPEIEENLDPRPTSTIALPTEVPTPTPSPTATPIPLPPQFLIEGLKIIPQKFNNCGPANLTILLNYYESAIDQQQVGGTLKPNYDDRNVSPNEMVDYVNNETDQRAQYFVGGSLENLKQLLANGFPVIVEKGFILEEYQGWMGHYLTLNGYDDAAKEFYSLDTFLGPWDNSGRVESYETIDELWEHFNYTFIVVYDPDDETKLSALLGEGFFDRELMWNRAAQRAQETVTEEPQNAFAWFNLGASLTVLGDLTAATSLHTSAAAAFDQAREIGLPWRMLWYRFEPYQAYLRAGRVEEVMSLTDIMINSLGARVVEETFFYRSQGLTLLGQQEAAEQALNRARELNPNHSQINSYVLPTGISDD